MVRGRRQEEPADAPAQPDRRQDRAEYGDAHRRLLQAMMAKGAVSDTQFGDMAVAAGLQDADTAVRQINAELDDLSMEIKRFRSELDGGMNVVLINRGVSDSLKHVGNYTTAQLNFIRALLRGLVHADSGFILVADALNSAENMKLVEAESLLEELVEARFLGRTRNKVYLDVRAACELELLLRNSFDVPQCSFCRQLVLIARSQTCHACSQRAHAFCVGQTQNKCPNAECGAAWNGAEVALLPMERMKSANAAVTEDEEDME